MIKDVLENIGTAKKLLTDIEKMIEKDKNSGYEGRWNQSLKCSKAKIERACMVARSYLKECYGKDFEGYEVYEKEIREYCKENKK